MRRAVVVGFGLGVLLARGSTGQTPTSTARALGMGFSYTAAAEGYEAIRWNPALLAIPGRPGFSLNIAQAGADFGSNTFGLADFRKYQGEFLTDADKDTLLTMVRNNGPGVPLSLELGAEVQALAFTIGNFGISLDAFGAATTKLSQDATELLLFGNARRVRLNERYDGRGTSIGVWSTATLSLSYGLSLPIPVGALAVGGTVKFARGIGIGYAENINTSLQNSPFDLRAGGHSLVTDSVGIGVGTGVAVDLGGAWELASGIRFGLVLENILNTMSWDDNGLQYSNKQVSLVQIGDQLQDTTIVDIDGVPFNPADPLQRALRDSLSALGTFPKLARAGVMYGSGMLTLAADLMVRLDTGLDFGDAQRASVGAELRLLPFLPLRAGIASDLESSTTFSGGAGLKLGPFRVDAAASNTPAGFRKGMKGAVGVSIMR